MTDFEIEFWVLVGMFEQENYVLSSMGTGTHSFTKIKALGKDAIPFLCQALAKGYDFRLMVILHDLVLSAGDKPPDIHEDDAGKVGTLTKKWVDWGISRGYIR